MKGPDLLKFLLPLLFSTSLAAAQEFDLSELPEGYTFVSIGQDTRSTVRFLRQEGATYIFEEVTEYDDGTRETAAIHTNRASQTTYWALGAQKRSFAPSDCGPSLGECTYTWIDSDGTVDMKSVTRLISDIWISDTYFRNEDTWVFWSRDCTIYDAYGFWYDFVRLYSDGESTFGTRARIGANRLDDLWQACDPPDYIS